MDSRGKTEGTIPAPASPSSTCIIQPFSRSGAGQTQDEFGLVALRPFASPLEVLHGGKDAKGPNAQSPLTAQVIPALITGRARLVPAARSPRDARWDRDNASAPCPHTVPVLSLHGPQSGWQLTTHPSLLQRGNSCFLLAQIEDFN